MTLWLTAHCIKTTIPLVLDIKTSNRNATRLRNRILQTGTRCRRNGLYSKSLLRELLA